MKSGSRQFWSEGGIPLIEPELLSGIIKTASDIALVVDYNGYLLSVLVNDEQSSFGRLAHWEGRDIRDFLTAESVEKFDHRLKRLVDGEEPDRPIEVSHTDNAKWEAPIRYSFHRLGVDGVWLMLGRDQRPIAKIQQQLVKAQMALEQDYQLRREHDIRFRALLNATEDPIAFVSADTGRISALNEDAAMLLGSSRDALNGATFAQLFNGRRKAELQNALLAIAGGDNGEPLELVVSRSGTRIDVTPASFRAGGEVVIVCRLSAADADLPSAKASVRADIFSAAVDAMVVIDASGTIETANDSFLELVNAPTSASVAGRLIERFMSRGSIDARMLIEHCQTRSGLRTYATRLVSDFGMQASVEITASVLDADGSRILLVMRDNSVRDTLENDADPAVDQNMSEVMELVGTTPLKEIVAQTSDVVEKICIESAVRMTRNNRVAAAEMLGLSRQSLYVKLRKYGLLDKDSIS